MKPAPFDYHRPETLDEVISLMGEHADEARPLAGGQSLAALMNTRLLQPSVLIDLGHVAGLDRIIVTPESVRLSAMTRQATAEHDAALFRAAPLMRAALHHVGAVSHRNRGTVCGSLAHADSVAELPCVAVALDAVFTINGPRGPRDVPAEEFFFGPLSTALDSDEILEGVTFTQAPPRSLAAFTEVRRNQLHGFAIVGVGAQLSFAEDGTCETARLAVMGVDDVPVRLRDAEDVLTGADLSPATLARVAEACALDIEFRADIHASAAYRRSQVRALTQRALAEIHSKSESLQ